MTMGAVSAVPAPDSRMAPGGPGYRRMSFALFLAGVATFALLYSTQALLPLISGTPPVRPRSSRVPCRGRPRAGA